MGLISRGYGGEFNEYKLSEIISHPTIEPLKNTNFEGFVGFTAIQRVSKNRLTALTFRTEKQLSIFDGKEEK